MRLEKSTPLPSFGSGLARMRSALGNEVADELLHARERAAAHGDSARVEVPVSTTWGWLFDRPGLTSTERAIAMLSVDVARGTKNALREHVRFALDVGVTPAAIRELLVHLGPYTGYPAINEVAGVVAEELARSRGSHRFSLPLGPVRRARLSLVVADARAAATMLGVLIGVDRWVAGGLGASGTTAVAGREVSESGLVAVGSTPTGLEIELLEPTGGGTSAHQDLLVSGPTTHYLGLVEAPVDELEASLPHLHQQDIATTTTRWDGASLAVLDTRKRLGYRIGIAAPDFATVTRVRGLDDEWHTPAPNDDQLLPPGPDEHLGIIAPDLHALTLGHARLLGRNTWRVLSFDSRRGTLSDTRLHGEPQDDGYLSSVAAIGDSVLELVQPTIGTSRYREAERDGKSHVHHLYTGHQQGLDAWAPLVCRLEQHGHRLAAEGTGWGGRLHYGYVDTRSALGIDLEIAAMDPDALRDADGAIAFSYHHHPTGARSAPERTP